MRLWPSIVLCLRATLKQNKWRGVKVNSCTSVKKRSILIIDKRKNSNSPRSILQKLKLSIGPLSWRVRAIMCRFGFPGQSLMVNPNLVQSDRTGLAEYEWDLTRDAGDLRWIWPQICVVSGHISDFCAPSCSASNFHGSDSPSQPSTPNWTPMLPTKVRNHSKQAYSSMM